ncbi:class I SAM-dependent methyltransferase [Paracraurococcus lichenis]|uniref:Class I SAM-dependent methyltransferase n=1 Tax=Paracraurococcus lichenis TaxID=3064888 RepID=A0ABT9E5P8_9PROT|nr:class I SAM-dependent methyltransferase [Paracraurococcus sp. LOR1-02]MDO9711491.1 class I SAM-dependent methyltransferase [Paracraurococcus sp. LOR1-02]
MPDSVLFPGRFRDLADVYAAGRPTYPPLLARRVATLVGLDGRQDVLDLGTGPGFLALDFHPYARRVTGIDPEPEMLRVARAAAAAAAARIDFVEGSSNDLGRHPGLFRLVTIGRAFHWMDRPRTLAALDDIIDPQGGVALFVERYPEVPANAWHVPFQAVIERYAVTDPAREVLASGKDHEAVLLASAFSHLERIAVLERRATPVQRLVDRALSFAKAWQGHPGSRRDDLAGEIRSVLQGFAEDGIVHEVLEGTALIARRPGAVS